MAHHWRQGLASEALVSVIEAVFMHPEAMHIKADVDASNATSIRWLQPLNFSREGIQKDKSGTPTVLTTCCCLA